MPKRARCPHCDKLFSREALDRHVMRCRMKDQKRERSVTISGRLTLILDGNNIAYYLSSDGVPRLQNLVLANHSLREAGYRPTIVISAALKHKIDKPGVLREMLTSRKVVEVQRGTNDDLLIIRMAQERHADIVSNDRFLNWIDRYPWVTHRLRRYRMTPAGMILL